MLDTFKQLIASQFEAALCTVSKCVDRCPETVWNSRVGNHLFCQVAFHALFYADYYLGPNERSFREQPCMHHRTQLLYLLRRLEVQRLPEGDVLRWEQQAGVA